MSRTNVLPFITMVSFEMLMPTDLFFFCLTYLSFCNTQAESLASARFKTRQLRQNGSDHNLSHVAKGRGRKRQRSITTLVPRQIDIDQVSDEEIQDIVITANLTPRKCLGFKTPFQAILKSKSLAKTCKSGSHSPVALGSRIQGLCRCARSTPATPLSTDRGDRAWSRPRCRPA